jgi:hypothetical protein
MKKGRLAEAWTSMKKLRTTELQASRDLYYAYVQFAEEMKIVQGVNYFTRLSELFTIPRCRRATLAAGVVMIAQQMCGINSMSHHSSSIASLQVVMAFYSSTIFVESGFNNNQALYASIGFGALNFVFAIPAIFTIDTFGRRSLLLATFPNMAWTLFVAGGCLYITSETTRLALVALFVYLFTIAYSIGEGPVPFMYSAEVFPLVQREQGMAFATSWCFLWAAVLGLTFPRMLRAFTPAGSFFFYGGESSRAQAYTLEAEEKHTPSNKVALPQMSFSESVDAFRPFSTSIPVQELILQVSTFSPSYLYSYGCPRQRG